MSIRRLSTSTLSNPTRYKEMSAGFVHPLSATYPATISYVVVAGGGGGGRNVAGGGGAGGYRTSYGSDLSGTQQPTETPLTFTSPTTLSVIVGAGGAPYTNGSDSTFHTITSTGGGRGSEYLGSPTSGGSGGGGSGGGSGDGGDNGAAGILGQGTQGGNRQHTSGGDRRSGGGGGAWVQGGNATTSVAGSGGQGAISTIAPFESLVRVGEASGSSIYFAGGGGGDAVPGTDGQGGLGGGGRSGNDGLPRTGGGGGGYGTGGSGVVVFRVRGDLTVDFSAGVTYSVDEVGDDKVYYVIATSTTSETVSIS